MTETHLEDSLKNRLRSQQNGSFPQTGAGTTAGRQRLITTVTASTRHPSALNTSWPEVVQRNCRALLVQVNGPTSECGTMNASHPQPAPCWRRYRGGRR